MNPFQTVIAWLRLMALSARCLPIKLLDFLRSVVSDARESAKAIFLRSVWASEQGFTSRARLAFSGYVAELKAHGSQAGFASINTIYGIVFGIVLVVFLISWIWQEGLPQIITATGNTTALETAGATTSQLNLITLLGGLLVLIILFGAVAFAIRSVGGGGGSSGGGKRRWYRRRR